MKVIILNGSPRKGWNTDLLLKEAEKAQGMPEQKLSTSIFMI
ncbi:MULTISPECIES: NAD(P)H-dependent oxidoreductase [Turicibacter]|jgi:multimeric flavodoxin WrbA|nr:NAD(P)H-dependent oxidoreductase [Turicibacter sp. H121]MCU7199373.1 NAD(P)H-dependent oxidoreductase [Turicibacter sp. H121]